MIDFDNFIYMVLFISKRLGNRERAVKWFHARNSRFNWVSPATLIKTGQESEVIDYLKEMGYD